MRMQTGKVILETENNFYFFLASDFYLGFDRHL